MMKRLLASLATAVFVLGVVRMASATPIIVQLTGAPASSVTVSESLSNATLSGNIDVDAITQYTLADNASVTVDFFNLILSMKDNGNVSGPYPWTINATLAFTLPNPLSPSGTASGDGGGTLTATRISNKAYVDGGTLVWEDATTELTDTFGNVIEITLLDNVNLGVVNWSPGPQTLTTSITATILNQGGGEIPGLTNVPEPTSLLLLGTGLGVIGLAAWRRKK